MVGVAAIEESERKKPKYNHVYKSLEITQNHSKSIQLVRMSSEMGSQ